ncbi:hypothetical protein GZH47_00945 [Paenibacillus rhizovicinus]|uniref:Uncharacterized protein n=1 Tax=Paenibacillus rhizovicinus TaxID=2704463 RepID=A0A6C0NTP4_9BACL|nr:hypothetical protein [Paenibacillus rhizovicinus]QHW29537.1 hypothetical protein GZH47_00945 [Paenibacillus rhizovicinus]
MKNKFVKNLSLAAIVLSLAILGTACGSSNSNSVDNSAVNASTNAAGDNTGDNSAAANNGSSANEAVSEDNAPTEVEAVFNAINADKTVEIETGVGPLTYKVSAELADKVSQWEKGTKVKYQYKEDTITAIDKE